jgi:large subunit ribosomal protein L21
MYAIIVDGGKQYKVRSGDEVTVDYRDAEKGSSLTFDRVLATSDGTSVRIGTPALAGASVTAEIVGTVQGPKLVVQKFRKRKNSRRRTGHRQIHTVVKIGAISG